MRNGRKKRVVIKMLAKNKFNLSSIFITLYRSRPHTGKDFNKSLTFKNVENDMHLYSINFDLNYITHLFRRCVLHFPISPLLKIINSN